MKNCNKDKKFEELVSSMSRSSTPDYRCIKCYYGVDYDIGRRGITLSDAMNHIRLSYKKDIADFLIDELSNRYFFFANKKNVYSFKHYFASNDTVANIDCSVVYYTSKSLKWNMHGNGKWSTICEPLHMTLRVYTNEIKYDKLKDELYYLDKEGEWRKYEI